MHIVCATNMPFVAEAFSTLGTTEILEGRDINAPQVRMADVLAVRSTTRVDEALLRGSRVRFVGTATIGTDHLDTDFLEAAGIRWCYAPGCNANSVSEYVVAALLCLACRHGFRLAGKTIGIIGVGNVGRRVARKAEALGLKVLLNDPPRERVGDDGDFQPLEKLLQESHILTLHVPMTDSGPDRTRYLVDDGFLDRARQGLILVNASRGAVVHTEALAAALAGDKVAHAVIDTWENEPDIPKTLLRQVGLGTPHIAGHSFEGKVEGTMMVYRAACRFLGRQPSWSPADHLPAPGVPYLDLSALDNADEQALLWQAVRAVYDIEEDDRRFREASTGPDGEAIAAFDRLRRNYPQRREFRFTRLKLPSNSRKAASIFKKLEFQVEDE